MLNIEPDKAVAEPGFTQQDDRVLPETKWLAILIVPFLIVAASLLFIWPNHTGLHFAWTIKPPMTSMMIAAAYIGGIYFFSRAATVQRWHAIKVGFLPVIAFASLLGCATLLHWDRFNHSHVSFWTWTALYVTTPFLVLAVWLRNRVTDPHVAESGDTMLSWPIRLMLGGIGLLTCAISLVLFTQPAWMIGVWPWMLTPLTARVMGAMFALPGLVGLGIAQDGRWSAARVILEAQSISIVFILFAAARGWSDFNQGSVAAWLFVGGLVFLLISLTGLYVVMETYQRRPAARSAAKSI